jgi:hypothetical protein
MWVDLRATLAERHKTGLTSYETGTALDATYFAELFGRDAGGTIPLAR